MSRMFLHETQGFKDLLNIVAVNENIDDPALVEKDYWLMHVLWSLKVIGLEFHLKGGTSLSKGYGCIHRFSEDIDIKIEPIREKCGFDVFIGKNQDSKAQIQSRIRYFQWVADYIVGKIHGIGEVVRDSEFDDVLKYRNGGIRLKYDSIFNPVPGLKDGILLEVGFGRTAPHEPRVVSSWALEHAMNSKVEVTDNRALNVLCYEPKYTFVEKLQALIRKFRLYKEGKQGASLPANFIRHYYDLYQLIQRHDVQDFIGTNEYLSFKKEHFGGEDLNVSKSEAFRLSEPEDRALFEKEYDRSKSLYFRGRPKMAEILERIGQDLDRL